VEVAAFQAKLPDALRVRAIFYPLATSLVAISFALQVWGMDLCRRHALYLQQMPLLTKLSCRAPHGGFL